MPYGAAFLQTLPMGRFGTMDELTKMVLFLASDDSSFCTGADFVADGGITENINLAHMDIPPSGSMPYRFVQF